MDSADFARWLRDATPYIRAHRGRTFVVLLDAEVVDCPNLGDLVRDLALLHALGIRLAIVHDAPGADAADVVDAQSRDALIAATGLVRSRLEAHFSALAPLGPGGSERIVLVGANLVAAKPRGIADGVDQQFAGEPRRIATEEIGRLLDQRCIVLLPPFGYSNAGEAFVLNAATLAAETATALGADKLIVYDAMERVNDISQISPSALAGLLASDRFSGASRSRLEALLRATRGGVARGHFISWRSDGALLRELFTAEGVGTQVSEGDYRTIRPARVADIPGILELIRPLEDAGLLVRRPRNRLEAEIDRFHVAELDGIVIGCCALYPHGDAMELACLAVHPSHRSVVDGKTLGERLLSHAREVARTRGALDLFVLTTGAEDWFAARGFRPAELDALPASKRALYNYRRNSRVLIESLAMRESGAAAGAVSSEV
ncbi:MAG: amino-acid N-acetyltransferase [Gammaproteobacteria bacterium]|nr:amino-acid N-acetyltransferase [Gammaproteobacteria bacterium]